jgi:hypothetical protein
MTATLRHFWAYCEKKFGGPVYAWCINYTSSDWKSWKSVTQKAPFLGSPKGWGTMQPHILRYLWVGPEVNKSVFNKNPIKLDVHWSTLSATSKLHLIAMIQFLQKFTKKQISSPKHSQDSRISAFVKLAISVCCCSVFKVPVIDLYY